MAITYISSLDAPSVDCPTSEASFYLLPATPEATKLINGALKVVNRTAGALSYTAYAVPDGDSSGDSNVFAQAISVPANDYLVIKIPQVNAATDIRHLCSSAGLTVHLDSGYLLS